MADDRRDQGRGRRGGGTPFLSVRDLVFGEPKPMPDGGTFEVGVSVLVLVGNQPPREDVLYHFMVDGIPRGNPQLLNPDGRASTKLMLSGKSPNVAIQLKWRHGTRLVSLRDVELPKLYRKLEVVTTAVQPFGFQIVLRRVGENGKTEPGPIAAYDWDPNPKREDDLRWRLMTWQQEDGDEFAMFTRSMFYKPRRITFFLPNDKEVRITVDVPAKQKPKQEVLVLPTKTESEKRREAAREEGKKWMEGIIAGYRPKPVEPPPSRKPIRTVVVNTLRFSKRIGSLGLKRAGVSSRKLLQGVGEILERIRRAISNFRERCKAAKAATELTWKRRIRR